MEPDFQTANPGHIEGDPAKPVPPKPPEPTPRMILLAYRKHARRRRDLMKRASCLLGTVVAEDGYSGPAVLRSSEAVVRELMADVEGEDGEKAMDAIVEGRIPHVVVAKPHGDGNEVAVHVARLSMWQADDEEPPENE